MPRCLLCPDQLSELADISFGDAWHRRFLKSETTGKSIVIVRSAPGNELFDAAIARNVIEAERTDVGSVTEAQRAGFKEAAGSRLMIRRLIRRPVPAFNGKRLRCKPSELVMQYQYLPSYFSSRRWTWPLISLFVPFRSLTNTMLLFAMRSACRLLRLLRKPGRPATADKN